MKFKNSSSLQIVIYLILTSSGFMNQCARCTKEVKDIALIEASVAAIQKTQQDIQRQVQPETYCIHHYWWHNNYMSLYYSILYINHTDPFIFRNLSALGRQITRHKTAEESKSLSGRHCLILCMLLLFQLLINYVFTWDAVT